MKKNPILIISSLLFLASANVFGLEGSCDKYFNGDPETTLQRLKADHSSEAQLCVGAMYYEGRGTEKNVTEAVKWIKKSAVQGNPVAQTNLGVFFLKGEGVKIDSGKAYDWFKKSANHNFELAQETLQKVFPAVS